MKMHKRRLRGGFAGFGEGEVAVDERGNIIFLDQPTTTLSTAEQLANARLAQTSLTKFFNVTGSDATATATVRSTAPAARQSVVNAKTNVMAPEEIPPSDPRHPDHDLWLADQAVLTKRARARAVAPYVVGGGALVAAVITVLVLKKRRAK